MKKFKVGIIGATGTVGQKFISLLENHPWFEISCVAASKNSAGKLFKEAVKDKWIIEKSIPESVAQMEVLDAFRDSHQISRVCDFVFCALSTTKSETKMLEETYAKLECPVISNNSANRGEPDVPMIIPELNAEHLKVIEYQKKRLGTKRGFIAVKSNCSIQCFVPAIYALNSFEPESILVCTYQAISGAGKNFDTWPEMKDNIIPFIEGEEEKSEIEPLKIWGEIQNGKISPNSKIKITSQCLRVPVSEGHSAAVFASFKQKITIDKIKEKWENFNPHPASVNLPSSPNKFLNYFPQPDRPQIFKDRNIHRGMGISIGRLRNDSQYDVKFVCMSHNTIRGAAGGAILLAEMLCNEKYITPKS